MFHVFIDFTCNSFEQFFNDFASAANCILIAKTFPEFEKAEMYYDGVLVTSWI